MKTLIFVLLMAVPSFAFAQDTVVPRYSLAECMDLALINNIQYLQSGLTVDRIGENLNQSKLQRLPSINGNYNYGLSKGRSIDPFTNTYIDQSLNFSNVGLNMEAQIFRGFELLHTIKRDKYNLAASLQEQAQARQQLAMQVAIAYYQVLNNSDLVQLAKLRKERTQEQVNRMAILYEEGSGNPADYSDIKAELINDETILTLAETNLKQARLSLKLLVNSDSSFLIKEEAVQPVIQPFKFTANQVLELALNRTPLLEARKYQLKSAHKNIEVAKANYLPALNLFAQVNTNFSSLANTFNETGTELRETGNFVTIGGFDYPVVNRAARFESQAIPYVNQLKNNLNTVIGLSVQLPIFNRHQTKNAVQQGRIEVQQATLALQEAENQLELEVESAFQLMQAAYKNYFLFKEQVDSYRQSFKINEVRFQNGVSNFLAYITSKNNLDRAQINLQNSYYEYKIRRQVLEFYL